MLAGRLAGVPERLKKRWKETERVQERRDTAFEALTERKGREEEEE